MQMLPFSIAINNSLIPLDSGRKYIKLPVSSCSIRDPKYRGQRLRQTAEVGGTQPPVSASNTAKGCICQYIKLSWLLLHL